MQNGNQNPSFLTVTAAIIEQDGRILIARRRPGKRHAGMWEFPGGKVESGESAEQCLVREIHEEFGITTAIDSFFAENRHIYDHGAICLMAFRVVWLDGNMNARDHDRIAWLRPEEILEFDLLPADIPIARALIIGNRPLNLPDKR